MIAALGTAGSFVVLRLLQRQPFAYALIGLGGSLLSFVLAQVLRRAEIFFLPDMITNLALAAVSLLSILLRRPLVAWTSHLVRRWPRNWYWHPRVRPAYTEATLAWAVYFLAQALLQWRVLQLQDAARMATLGLFTGWPANGRPAHPDLPVRHMATGAPVRPECGRVPRRHAPALDRTAARLLAPPPQRSFP